MRESQTAVLERGIDAESGVFVTEPFEVPWAVEARWFIQFLEEAEGEAELRTQISADGLTWVDHEDAAVTVPLRGVASIPVRDFGHWLRISAASTSGSPLPLTRVYLALKG